ncbi:MAG: hypothetical protein Q9M36_10555 [Sulfurovum sp.]|nr:hypothetical protein [Sulfurovum sp.]
MRGWLIEGVFGLRYCSIDENIFDNTASSTYWSSTSYTNGSAYFILGVDFYGGDDKSKFTNYNLYIRCVRAKQ